jgi:hypothetical protein
MKKDPAFGVDLSGLLTARAARELSKSTAEALREVLLDILSDIEKKAKDKSSPNKMIRYTRNGFGNYDWNSDHAAIRSLLDTLGYITERKEEYNQFTDVYLVVSWE